MKLTKNQYYIAGSTLLFIALVVALIFVALAERSDDAAEEVSVDVFSDGGEAAGTAEIELASDKDFYNENYRFALNYPEGWFVDEDANAVTICDSEQVSEEPSEGDEGIYTPDTQEGFCVEVAAYPEESVPPRFGFSQYDIKPTATEDTLNGKRYLIEEYSLPDAFEDQEQFRVYYSTVIDGYKYLLIGSANDELTDVRRDYATEMARSLVVNPEFKEWQAYESEDGTLKFSYPTNWRASGDLENGAFIGSPVAYYDSEWSLYYQGYYGDLAPKTLLQSRQDSGAEYDNVEEITIDGYPAVKTYRFEERFDSSGNKQDTEIIEIFIDVDGYFYALYGQDLYRVSFEDFYSTIEINPPSVQLSKVEAPKCGLTVLYPPEIKTSSEYTLDNRFYEATYYGNPDPRFNCHVDFGKFGNEYFNIDYLNITARFQRDGSTLAADVRAKNLPTKEINGRTLHIDRSANKMYIIYGRYVLEIYSGFISETRSQADYFDRDSYDFTYEIIRNVEVTE